MSGEAGKGDKRRPCDKPEEARKSHHDTFGSKCLRCRSVKVATPYAFCDKCLKETE